MRGHQAILAMRKRGAVPVLVQVETDAIRLKHDDLFPADPDFARIEIDPTENARRLDLRCVVGLTVLVGGTDAERVEAIANACTRAQAGRVIATTHRHTSPTRTEVVRVTDTQGALSWQES